MQNQIMSIEEIQICKKLFMINLTIFNTWMPRSQFWVVAWTLEIFKMCSTIHQLTHNFCFPMFLYLQSITTANPSSNLSQWCKCEFNIGVFDTLSDSIQCLDFAKKIIHSIFDSILLCPRLNSKYYSIKKFCWFNSKDNSIQYSGDHC